MSMLAPLSSSQIDSEGILHRITTRAAHYTAAGLHLIWVHEDRNHTRKSMLAPFSFSHIGLHPYPTLHETHLHHSLLAIDRDRLRPFTRAFLSHFLFSLLQIILIAIPSGCNEDIEVR
jgi:hypothetical protein